MKERLNHTEETAFTQDGIFSAAVTTSDIDENSGFREKSQQFTFGDRVTKLTMLHLYNFFITTVVVIRTFQNSTGLDANRRWQFSALRL